MAMPRGCRSSAPTPPPKASGTPPSRAAIVVMRIGRKRSRHASSMASRAGRPCVRCMSSAKSIIMIAFFITMPISKMMPISAITDSSSRVRISASSAPRPAEGRVDRIVTGCTQLS